MASAVPALDQADSSLASRPRSVIRRAAVLANSAWPAIAFVVALLVIWQLAVIVFDASTLVLPRPTKIAQSIADNWNLLFPAIGPTLEETVLGFALSAVVGIPIAVAITWSALFERTVYPTLVAAQIVPKVALAPLFLLWFGYGINAKVAVAFSISAFPIIINTVVGLRATDPQLLLLARSTGAGRFRTFRKITFINALPNIFGSFEIAITLALIGAVVGEFISANSGLGYLLLTANGDLNTPLVFADLVVLTALGALLFGALVLLKSIVIPLPIRQARRSGRSLDE